MVPIFAPGGAQAPVLRTVALPCVVISAGKPDPQCVMGSLTSQARPSHAHRISKM